MQGRKRRATRPQGDRQIRSSQDGFISGMNLDSPSSEIGSTQVRRLDNLIPFRNYLKSRSGVEKYNSANLPGTGEIFNLGYHRGSGYFILHRDGKIFVSKDCMATWLESNGNGTVSSNSSEMQEIDDDLVIFQDEKILYLELDSLLLRQMNAPNPTEALNIASADIGTNYKYRFDYTYARIVDGVIVTESGNRNNTDIEQPNYIEIETNSELTSSSQVTFTGFVAPTDTDFTHIRIYRTLNINATSTDPNQFFLTETLSFSEAETYSTSSIPSLIIGSTFIVKSDNSSRISASDNVIVKKPLMSTLDFQPIPSGLHGVVGQSFLLVAKTSGKTISYCSIADRKRAGYYDPAFQFIVVDDSINRLQGSPDISVVLCNRSTYRLTLFTTNDAGEKRLGRSVPVIEPPTLMDDNIGVLDTGSIASMDLSRFIAHCSDSTIRVWNGSSWGIDLSQYRVNSEIKKITNGSVGLYSPDGFYLLFYSDDLNSNVTTKCLRLGLAEDVGSGWNFMSGDAWPKPYLGIGALRSIDCNDNIQRLLVLDKDSSDVFQVETFNGPSNSSLNVTYYDGDNNTPYNCSVEFSDDKGSSENFFIYHMESNFFVSSPVRDNSNNYSSFFNVYAYVDDEFDRSAVEDSKVSINNNYNEDGLLGVSFPDELKGHRIRLKLESTGKGFILRGLNTVYRVQDRQIINQNEPKYLSELSLSSDLCVWLNRKRPLINSAHPTNQTITITNGSVSLSEGLDSLVQTAITGDSTAEMSIPFYYNGTSNTDNVLISGSFKSLTKEVELIALASETFVVKLTPNANDITLTIISLSLYEYSHTVSIRPSTLSWINFEIFASSTFYRIEINQGFTGDYEVFTGNFVGLSDYKNSNMILRPQDVSIYDLRVYEISFDSEYYRYNISKSNFNAIMPFA